MDEVTYRAAYKSEWDICMDLAWRTFLKFDAPDYPQEGIDNFREFVTDEVLKNMFHSGEYQLFVAVCAKKIIGIISLRDRNHISLLFVDEKYQHTGIGRALIDCVMDYLCSRKVLPLDNEEDKIPDMLYEKEPGDFCTVNAAPYAENFYKTLGFEQTAEAFEREGIVSIPMKLLAGPKGV